MTYRIKCYRDKNIINEFQDYHIEELIGELVFNSDLDLASLISTELTSFKGIKRVELEEIK